jgi:hypothetical protein
MCFYIYIWVTLGRGGKFCWRVGWMSGGCLYVCLALVFLGAG